MLRYPLPYPHDSPPLPLVPQQPAELQYGNPYCEENTRGAYRWRGPALVTKITRLSDYCCIIVPFRYCAFCLS